MTEIRDPVLLREISRQIEKLGASSDRTVLLRRREVDPKTGCSRLHWWVEPIPAPAPELEHVSG